MTELNEAGDGSLPEWHVAVEGCTNFRDAGGWPLVDGGRMRTGVLYRSDDPTRATAPGREVVAALGLVRVVDLRQHSQFVRSPGFIAAEHTAHVPLVDRMIDPADPPSLDTPSDIADLYEAMLERSTESLALALDEIAGNVGRGPVLVHCAYGKDRAGLAVALVQAAVGVGAAAIVADYARSDAPAAARRRLIVDRPLPDDPDVSHVPATLFRAPAAAMEELLVRVTTRFGSLESWVASFPIAGDTVGRMCDALVER